jgi:hypothetical protein
VFDKQPSQAMQVSSVCLTILGFMMVSKFLYILGVYHSLCLQTMNMRSKWPTYGAEHAIAFLDQKPSTYLRASFILSMDSKDSSLKGNVTSLHF